FRRERSMTIRRWCATHSIDRRLPITRFHKVPAMKSGKTILAPIALVMVLAGCDGIFEIDNWEAPNSRLTGQLHFNGDPVGVRLGSAEVEIWQIEPEYPIEEKISANVDQDGTYSTVLFDGTYEINVLSGSGAWMDQQSRQQVVVRGNTVMDIPVTPFHTIDNETVTYSAGPGEGGTITA